MDEDRRRKAFEHHENREDEDARYKSIYREYEITANEADVLLHVRFGREIQKSPTEKSRAVSGLESKSLLFFAIDKKDKRKRVYYLTPEGKRTADEVLDKMAEAGLV